MSDQLSAEQAASAHGGAGRRRKVVIVGGGFGGAAAARGLRHADAEVTVVDRINHHLFQPLLYQVAAGLLSMGECASPIRSMLKHQANTSVLMAAVTGIDADRRQVVLGTGERLDYDSLILAGGAETSYFGRDEWADVSFGLKTLSDAVALRDRIFGAFEEAARTTDPDVRDEWLTFIVVGGGPTGVEISGQLAILARDTLNQDFKRIDTRKARVILVDAGDRVVPAFSERLSAKTAEYLDSLGVVIREGAMATSIDPRGVEVKVGDATERIAARTVVWAAGVRAAGVAAIAARATGADTDRGGRLRVQENCTLAGHPEISVIGDMANHPGPHGKPLPGLATVAIQQAQHVAKAINAGQVGASAPFRYFDKGALAVIGRGKAVCEVRGRKLWGPIAYYMYLSVHLFYLSGVLGHRLGVLAKWIGARFGMRGDRVIVGELPGAPIGGEQAVERGRPTPIQG
jgi:NADH:ubiquinone reductase (H+-translocating)